MKSKIILVLIIIGLGIIISYCYINFLPQSTVVGTYVNRNYDQKPFLVEIPYVADTLILFENGQFESAFWGKGIYRITHGIEGTEIDWSYRNEFGKGGFNTSISRLNWGSPKIVLDRDRNHYYEKINN